MSTNGHTLEHCIAVDKDISEKEYELWRCTSLAIEARDSLVSSFTRGVKYWDYSGSYSVKSNAQYSEYIARFLGNPRIVSSGRLRGSDIRFAIERRPVRVLIEAAREAFAYVEAKYSEGTNLTFNERSERGLNGWFGSSNEAVLPKRFGEQIDKLEEAYEKAVEAEIILNEAATHYDGWSRFWVVPGGHIHSSRRCHSCNKGKSPTVFYWMTNLSGLTETEAVEQHGEVLCTVCFASAPVNWQGGKVSKKDAEAIATGTYTGLKVDDTCPGTGTFNIVEGSLWRGYNRATAQCAECSTTVNVNTNGGLRKHKKEKVDA